MKRTVHIAGSDTAVLELSDPVELVCGMKGCSANCCTHGPHIILNPYEIALICRGAAISYEDFLDLVETDRVNGFPLIMLPREPACPFWTDAGCRIYTSRPLACRLFPLGRVFENGESCYVLPDRNRCSGIVAGGVKTLKDYLAEQDTATHVRMADAWIEFVTQIESLHLPDKPVTSVAFHLLVYSPDTPPSPDLSRSPAAPEDRFLLRLDTARTRLLELLKLR